MSLFASKTLVPARPMSAKQPLVTASTILKISVRCAGDVRYHLQTSTIRTLMRLTNNYFVGTCPSMPPFTGAADVRIAAVISLDWLKDAGAAG